MNYLSMSQILAKRPPILPPAVWIEHDGVSICWDAHLFRVDGKPHHTDPRTFKLLYTLIANRGRVLNRQQLLDHVWGNTVAIEERTVDVYIRRLRLVLRDRAYLLRAVRGCGYRFGGEP